MSTSPGLSARGLISINERNKALTSTVELGGRFLLAVLFLPAALGQLDAYGSTETYMAAAGVPRLLLPLVIVTEICGALAIVLGWQTRIVAFLLAGFSLLTAIVFHHNFTNHAQEIIFFKSLSIAGGFLLLVAHGPGPLSVDRRLKNDSAP